MKKILIFSSCEYSLNNKGDHAMLDGLLSWLGGIAEPLQITAYEMNANALSSISDILTFPSPELYMLKGVKNKNKTDTIKSLAARLIVIFRGTMFISKFLLYKLSGTRLQKDSSILGFFNQILTADALIFSGGGYLNGIWWADGLYSKLFPALVARISGVPIILTSQGLGPYPHILDRLVARLLFSSSTIIGVRDKDSSSNIVKSLSKRFAKKIFNTGDDALFVKSTHKSKATNQLEAEGIPVQAKELIAVNLRDSSSYSSKYPEPPFAIIASALDKLLEQNPDRHVIFVPISYHEKDSDRESAEKIIQQMNNPARATNIIKKYSPSDIKGIVSQASISIGTSYHFLLFSLSQNIPAIALFQDKYYKQKLEGLTRLYKQSGYCFELNKLNSTELITICEEIITKKTKLRQELKSTNQQLNLEFEKAHKKISHAIKGI